MQKLRWIGLVLIALVLIGFWRPWETDRVVKNEAIRPPVRESQHAPEPELDLLRAVETVGSNPERVAESQGEAPIAKIAVPVEPAPKKDDRPAALTGMLVDIDGNALVNTLLRWKRGKIPDGGARSGGFLTGGFGGSAPVLRNHDPWEGSARVQGGFKLEWPPSPSVNDKTSKPVDVRTDFNGRFELYPPAIGGHFEVPELSMLVYGSGILDKEVVYVACSWFEYGGAVMDHLGNQAKGANVQVKFTLQNIPGRLFGLMDVSQTFSRSTKSGDHGQFSLGMVPFIPGTKIEAYPAGGGYVMQQALPEASDKDLILTLLAPPKPTKSDRLSGIVLREDGSRAAGAILDINRMREKADENGAFDFAYRSRDGMPAWLLATEGDALAARVEVGANKPNSGLVLKLGPPALRISGVLMEESGEPIPNASILVVDGHGQSMRTSGSGFRMDRSLDGSVEWTPNTPGLEGSVHSTNEEGRFSVWGLENRDYTLAFVLSDQSSMMHTDPIRAGTLDESIYWAE